MAVINMTAFNGSGKVDFSENVFTRLMGPVAKEVLGKPSKEAKTELRFGTHGSMSIDLEKGSYFDHEMGRGGGVLDFLNLKLGLEKPDALSWLEAHNFLEAKEPVAVRRQVATYDYHDASGALLFQVVRYEPKEFLQRRPNGAGGWLWSTKDIELVLYRLPKLLAAVAAGETVYVVEGEKAADRLATLGFAATCSPRGANKWRAEYSPSLTGADVVILPDNDATGFDHAESVARHLAGIAARVRVLELPELPPKGDVADWIEAGGTAGQFTTLVEGAPDAGVEAIPQLAPAPKPTAKPVKRRALPADLLDVEGVLGEIIAYCNVTAISPQPFLAMACAIVAVGVLAGRRYRTSTNLRTNIYAVGIADSGAGKDHARKRIKAIFSAAGLSQYLGGEDIASGAAMFTALQRFPCVLFQIDEFGNWLDAVLSKHAGQHKKQIAERLKTLFSSADTNMIGTEYADQSKLGKPREDIIQPHACLYGTTTPDQFWSALAGSSLNDGLLARVLICVSPESYPDEQIPAQIPPPDSLVAGFQAIARGADDPEAGNLASIMSSSMEPQPYLVPNTPEADRAIVTLRQEQLAIQRCTNEGYVKAIMARWTEHAVKLALVRAISRNPARPVIEARDVVWGRTLAKHCIDTLLTDASRNIADDDYGRRLNKCLEIIRRHGEPISERELIRKGFRVPEKERAEALRTLVESEQLIAISRIGEGGGRPTIKYAISE